MAIISSKLARHKVCKDNLVKSGAKIYGIQDLMYYVNFEFSGKEFLYLYMYNEENIYRLERLKPYPLIIGEYKSEEEAVDVIIIDIEQFKQATNSSNFNEFVNIDNNLIKLTRSFEDLYLYYNISKSDLVSLRTNINLIFELIYDIKQNSERIYFKKNPDTLE